MELALYDITTEWVTYEYIFEPDVSLDTARIGLLLGFITGTDANTKIYIDDFDVEEYIPD